MADKRKTPPKEPAGKKPKKRSDVTKIYKTTDGLFTGRADITKPRRVAAIDQRKDDGALAVVKIYSKKGRDGKLYIDKLVLKPEDHESLTEDSIVGSKLLVGIKIKTESGEEYKPLFERDFAETGDRLTKAEHKAIKKGIRNKGTAKKWKKHFKE